MILIGRQRAGAVGRSRSSGVSDHDHQDGDRAAGMTAGPTADGAGTSWSDGEAPDRIVTAGPWTLSLRGAELADIQHAGHPVLRGIRFIVRDHDWRTAENLIIDIGDDDPRRLRFTVRSLLDGVPVLRWDAELGLGPELDFVVRGRVLRTFRRNRIGLWSTGARAATSAGSGSPGCACARWRTTASSPA